MKTVVLGRWPVISVLALLCAAICITGCSLPSLESEECAASRDTVREFYSYHFGHDLGFKDQDLDARRGYLTPGFFESLRNQPGDLPPGTDPFTRMENPPKAFRIGECKVLKPGERTSFEVVLFWKDNTRSEQQAINAEVQKEGSSWLIDRVSK